MKYLIYLKTNLSILGPYRESVGVVFPSDITKVTTPPDPAKFRQNYVTHFFEKFFKKLYIWLVYRLLYVK